MPRLTSRGAKLARWAAAGAGLALTLTAASSFPELEHEAIQYSAATANDPAARLNAALHAKEIRLERHPVHGYLPAVLEALEIPVESQILVFSKTSFQASRINSVTPRAIYFNDEASIGYVLGGEVLEVAAQDPRLGTVFYTLDQDPLAPRSFERRGDDCLQCHVNAPTSGVPGLLIRSVYTESSGMPMFRLGGFITDHRSPLEERWGGWFVTGQHGAQKHLGNSFAQRSQQPVMLHGPRAMNRGDLPSTVRRDAVLSPHSDIVALMVAEHQFHGMNLITRLGFEARFALHAGPEGEETVAERIRPHAETLLEYLLFVEETPLTDPVQGTSGFQEVFEQAGPADSQGRSLRQLDLERRLFRYPLSYLVYTPAFHGLPPQALQYLGERLAAILTSADAEGKFGRLSAEDRRNVLAILAATQSRLPAALAAQLPDAPTGG